MYQLIDMLEGKRKKRIGPFVKLKENNLKF